VLSPRAAALFGLDVLADPIQDVDDNRTRFLVVAGSEDPDAMPPWRPPSADGRRTILVFGVRNEPGTLLAALRTFADREVNLSKLESRPSRERAWEYVFWANLDAGVEEPACAAGIEELRGRTTMVRVLGSYRRPASA
jgi:prephenate dehydratase